MENLDWLEWEAVTTPLKITNIIEHGAFPETITSIELKRDAKLNLIAVGKGTGSFSLDEHINLKSGEFAIYPEDTLGRTEYGVIVRLKGVLLVSVNNTSNNLQVEDTDLLFLHAQVSEVEVFQSELPIVKQIDWIINFSTENYILTRSTKREYSLFLKLQRSGEYPLERSLNKSNNCSLDHFRCECTINDQKWSLILGNVREDIAQKKYQPGFLEFDNLNNNCLPSEDTSQTILAALSFVLGRPIISVGSTFIGKNGDRVRLTAKKIRLLQENVYKQPSYIPTPLGITGKEWCINEIRFSRIISDVATKMEMINIEYPLFLVWVGLASPLDVQAVHFGAAIESLRTEYCRYKNDKLSRLFIDKTNWKQIQDKLKNTLNEMIGSSIDKIELNILIRNIENLNQKSSNMQYSEFFDLLSIKIGEVETKALKERNNPAHGHHYKSSDYPKLSMIVQALYSLFTRLVLKITEASDCYIDYSTYGYPVRHIDEPLGGPEGDGKAMKLK